jgi:hypothetical protein
MPQTLIAAAALSLAVQFPVLSAKATDDCDNGSFDSTYDLIQEAIFENKGCTAEACHAAATAAGGLDLTAGASYDDLVGEPALTVDDYKIPGLLRVVPSQKDQSLLFLNLAAATSPDQWTAPLRAMPIGFDPLSLDELEAVRLWIEQGAPRQGTVPGTGELLDACLPPAEPIAVQPLAPPAAGAGVQIRMPKWILPAQSEGEVCFASYYDVSDQVAPEFRGSNGTTFLYKRQQIRQDPLSHHLIVDYYGGAAGTDDPRWGTFRCRGGNRDGETCEATDREFCGEGLCGTDWVSATGCIGFGPPDGNDPGNIRSSLVIIQEASAQLVFPTGTFREAPLKGMMVWNSHAFNLTDVDGKVEAWMNFEFARPDDQVWLMERLFNISNIFSISVPPFEAREVCRHHLFEPNTRLYELSSHTHRRGKRFETFWGRYTCQGGPNQGAPCYPLSTNGILVPDLCPESTCEALEPPEYGDCDGDARVDTSDLITCVGIALEQKSVDECPTGDPNGSGDVSVAELIGLVRTALAPPTFRNPEDDHLYTNLVYNDPTVILYDPPMALSGPEHSAASRTFTYCSLYDNGFTDPTEVKKRANSPQTSPIGGPCRIPTGCTEGRIGTTCSGATEEERNTSCDSAPGVGDGFCDGCMVTGGTTTEDEMFILMGAYYIED